MPSTALRPVNFRDLVRCASWDAGIAVPEVMIDHILWEHTGYPSFFMDDPYEDCLEQLREYFAGIVRCERCGSYIRSVSYPPPNWQLCHRCITLQIAGRLTL